MYIRTPRGSVRRYRMRSMGYGDVPLCSQAQVGQQCTPDDQTSTTPATTSTGTSTSDWLKSVFGSGSSSTPAATTPTATTPTTSGPDTVSTLANAIGKIFGQQPAAPGVATGSSTGTIVLLGALGLGAVLLLRKKKKSEGA